MKIRTGHVSNSSSSSFIVIGTDIYKGDIVNLVKNNIQNIDDFDCESLADISAYEISDAINSYTHKKKSKLYATPGQNDYEEDGNNDNKDSINNRVIVGWHYGEVAENGTVSIDIPNKHDIIKQIKDVLGFDVAEKDIKVHIIYITG